MFTKESKVGEVLKIEGIIPIVEKRIGKKIPLPMLKMGKGMTLAKVAQLLNLTEKEIDEALEELNAAAKGLTE